MIRIERESPAKAGYSVFIVRLPDELFDRLVEVALKSDRTVSEIVKNCIEKELEEE